MNKLGFTFVLILCIMGLFSFSSKKRIPINGSELINKLTESGYFKYADSKDIEALKNDLRDSYEKYKILSTIIDEKTLLPKDYRLYFCDGEALFEIGGIEEYLGYAKHAFEKRGLKLVWENEISEENGNNWSHKITVNGKEYIAFHGSMKRMDIWGTAQLNFYRLLNDQLELQQSNERIYPISGGEEGQFAFLTKEQFDLISSNFYQGKEFSKFRKLYRLEDWAKVHGLK